MFENCLRIVKKAPKAGGLSGGKIRVFVGDDGCIGAKRLAFWRLFRSGEGLSPVEYFVLVRIRKQYNSKSDMREYVERSCRKVIRVELHNLRAY